MPFLSTPGARIYYEQWGAGNLPALLMVNGFQRSHSDFRAIGRNLVDIGFAVGVLDNRGVGKSESINVFTIDDMARDIAAVAKEIFPEKFSVLGISLGGMIVQRAALSGFISPEKMILVSTSPRIAPWKMNQKFLMGQSESYYFENLKQYVAPHFFKANPILMRAMAKQIQQLFSSPQSIKNSEAQANVLIGFDVTAELPKLHLPTLIIHGENDAIITVGAARELHSLIPRSTLKVFPNAGHLLLAESSKTLLREISHFISSENANNPT